MKIVLKDSSDEFIIQRGNESVSAFTQIRDAISGGGLTGVTLNGTAATVTNNVAALTADIHSHSNKSALDLITTAQTTNWNSAYSNMHSHSNKSALDSVDTILTNNYVSGGTMGSGTKTTALTVSNHTLQIPMASESSNGLMGTSLYSGIQKFLKIETLGLTLDANDQLTVSGKSYNGTSGSSSVTLKEGKAISASTLDLSINNSTYVLTLSGKSIDGSVTINETVDLPLEEMVVSGSYNNTTKKVVLSLKNGSDVEFSVADLVSGLQSEITSSNKLSADLVQDGTTNKVVTSANKTQWNNAISGVSLNGTAATVTNHVASLTGVATTTALNTHTGDTTVHITANDRSNWNCKVDSVELGTSNPSAYSLQITEGDTQGLQPNLSQLTLSGGTNITITTGTPSSNIETSRVIDLSQSAIQKLVPSYSSADNGKILMVVNGALAWVNPTTIYTGTGTPSSSQGNNGDIYLQTS